MLARRVDTARLLTVAAHVFSALWTLVLALAGFSATILAVEIVSHARRRSKRRGAILLEAALYLGGPINTILIGFYSTGPEALQQIDRAVVLTVVALTAVSVAMSLIEGSRRGSGPLAAAFLLFHVAMLLSFWGGAGDAPYPEVWTTTPLMVLAFILSPHMTFELLLTTVRRAIRLLLMVNAAVGIALPAVSFESVDPRTLFGFHRFQGITLQPNVLGLILVMGLVLELYRRSWLWSAVVVIQLALTQSHTSWLAAGIGVVVLVVAQHPHLRTFAAGSGVMIGTILIASPGVATDFLLDLSGQSGDTLTFTGRTRIWDAAMEGFRQYPVFGWGPGFLGDSYRDRFLPFFAVATHAHNQWFQTLGGQGVVGAATLVGLIGTVGFLAWQTRAQTKWIGIVLLLLLVVNGTTETPLRPVGPDFYTVIEILVFCAPLYAATDRRQLRPSPLRQQHGVKPAVVAS